MRFSTFLYALAIVFLNIGPAAYSQESLYEGYPANWKGERLYPLIFSTAELSKEDRAERFIDWMNNNDWQAVQLDIQDAYNLFDKIKIDLLDRQSFSARWSGFITAPATGSYTFRQVQDYSGNSSSLTLLIDGAVVLDSGSEKTDGDRFSSSVVHLVAGRPTPIALELVHALDNPIGLFSRGAPMAFMTWRLTGFDEKIIPESAFTPTASKAQEAATGLSAEYFRSIDFTDLVQSRVDPSLDLIWSMPPVACKYELHAPACFRKCVALALDPEYLLNVDASVENNALDYYLPRIAYCMKASDRQRLVELLLSNPEIMRRMNCESMGRLWQSIYMLPSGDQVTLLGEWSLVRPQPRFVAGTYPGWGDASYQKLNTDFYWLMGLFLQGPYWEHVDRLWEEYLVLPNGECNLHIAYLTTFSTNIQSIRLGGRSRQLLIDLLDNRLDEEEMVGDERVSWLIARAFAEEMYRADGVGIRPGSEHLDEASLVAESEDYRFWARQEKAVRYASLGEVESLEDLIAQMQPILANRIETTNHWVAVAASQRRKDVLREAEIRAKKTGLVISELERRRNKAQQHGNHASASRYEALLLKATPASE